MHLPRVEKRQPRGSAPLLATMLAAALAATPANAFTIEDARAVYEEGRFLEAAALAEALGTSDGYALAAHALAIQGQYLAEAVDEKQALFLRAVELAEEALRLDGNSAYAHQEIAHATGRYAETLGFAEALAGGYAERVRDSIRRALEIEPDPLEGHLAMAGWHTRILHAAGFMGGLLYAASRDQAHEHYARAHELSPDNPAVTAQHAIGLLYLDPEEHRAEADAMLDALQPAAGPG